MLEPAIAAMANASTRLRRSVVPQTPLTPGERSALTRLEKAPGHAAIRFGTMEKPVWRLGFEPEADRIKPIVIDRLCARGLVEYLPPSLMKLTRRGLTAATSEQYQRARDLEYALARAEKRRMAREQAEIEAEDKKDA